MSILIYLFIFSIFPYISSSRYTYGQIYNASIKELDSDTSDKLGYTGDFDNCDQCLCYAFSRDNIFLLTCTQNQPINFNVKCQFYYFMPARKDIVYPKYDASIYIIKNETFEEKDDCCDTQYLIHQITTNSTEEKYFADYELSSLSFGDNNTIVTTASKSGSKKIIKFNKLTMESIYFDSSGYKAIGYDNNKYYYLGNTGDDIKVYNKTFCQLTANIHKTGGGSVTVIRFLDETNMIVSIGVLPALYIYEKTKTDESIEFTPKQIGLQPGGQLHAIGIVNSSAFYIGWADKSNIFYLYTKSDDGKWTLHSESSINMVRPTYGIFIDNCGRLWAVEAEAKTIFIHDPDREKPYEFTTKTSNLFNLLVLDNDNYIIFTSHATTPGLTRIDPNVNCRSPPLKRQ